MKTIINSTSYIIFGQDMELLSLYFGPTSEVVLNRLKPLLIPSGYVQTCFIPFPVYLGFEIILLPVSYLVRIWNC